MGCPLLGFNWRKVTANYCEFRIHVAIIILYMYVFVQKRVVRNIDYS